MKIVTGCYECFLSTGKPHNIEFTLTNNLIYSGQCEQGHNYAIALDMFKFEILFELGLIALANGSHSDAIKNFATFLERFFEFSIYAFSLHYISFNEIDMFWKEMKKQSERQYGAYISLYLNYFKKMPSLHPENMTPDKSSKPYKEFRNNVVHSGYIAKREEAIAYGQLIYDYIYNEFTLIKSDNHKICEYIYQHQIDEEYKSTGHTIPLTRQSGTYLTSSSHKDIEDMVDV